MRTVYAILATLMVLFVFTGSIGVNLYRSYCDMRGEVETFLTSGNDLCLIMEEQSLTSCCSEVSSVCKVEEGKKGGCCSEEEITIRIDLPFSQQYAAFGFTDIVFAPVPLPVVVSSVTLADCPEKSSIRVRPPPRYFGKNLLPVISVWRI